LPLTLALSTERLRITGYDRRMTASVQFPLDTTKPLVTAKLYTGKELRSCVHVSTNFAHRGHVYIQRETETHDACVLLINHFLDFWTHYT
jgi:ATP sulfurylase